MNLPLITGLAALLGAGVLVRLCLDWRHDQTVTRLSSAPFPGCVRVSRDEVSDELPLPRRVRGASLDWDRHVDGALGVAREAVAGESAGRVVIEVSARHASQRCAQCGHVAKGNRVTQAAFKCLACGHEAHADINAAENILRAGLALQEAQDAV